MSRQLSGEISCFPGEGEKKKGAKKATKATLPPGMAASYGKSQWTHEWLVKLSGMTIQEGRNRLNFDF